MILRAKTIRCQVNSVGKWNETKKKHDAKLRIEKRDKRTRFLKLWWKKVPQHNIHILVIFS